MGGLREIFELLSTNSSWIELVYTLVSLIGVAGGIWTTADAFKQFMRVKRDLRRGEAHRLITWGHVRRRLNRLVFMIWCLILGVTTMFLPPAEPNQSVQSMEQNARLVWLWILTVRLGLVGCTLIIVLDTVMDVIELRRLMPHLVEKRKDDPPNDRRSTD
jgi:hypothetical protein